MPRKFVFFLAALLTALPSMAMNSGTSGSRSVNLTIDNHFQKDAIERPARGEELIVAYYGHPNSRYMGIVGRYSLHELVEKVKATARLYQQLLPEHTIIPAIYLIYGTCQPQGRIGYLSDAIVNRYIDYAKDQNVKIILDHQIGSYSLKSAVDKLLPYLSFPHVHIAFDFEWRTSNPMKEIGFVMGEELNWMQKYVSDHLINNNIPGNKYIIFHQFTASMLREHHKASTGFPQVDLVHCTSGWGPPWQKKATHTFNATITQIPIKGFKLWYYYSDKPGIHYDSPLMVPQEVLALNPRPRIIIYQ